MNLSETEVWFRDWLDKMIEVGYIHSYGYECTTFNLFDGADIIETWHVKKKDKTVTKSAETTLLQPASLTSDFTIYWTSTGFSYLCKWLIPDIKDLMYLGNLDYFVAVEQEDYTYRSEIEIKPHYEGKNINSSIEFPIKQKWVWDKYGVFIQKIKPIGDLKKSIKYWHSLSLDKPTTKLKMPNSLFDLTFYPNSFFYTETGKLKRNKEFDIELINILPTFEKWYGSKTFN